MTERDDLMSDAFQVFMREAPKHAQAWMAAVKSVDAASALDKKTESLAIWPSLQYWGLKAACLFMWHLQKAPAHHARR